MVDGWWSMGSRTMVWPSRRRLSVRSIVHLCAPAPLREMSFHTMRPWCPHASLTTVAAFVTVGLSILRTRLASESWLRLQAPAARRVSRVEKPSRSFGDRRPRRAGLTQCCRAAEFPERHNERRPTLRLPRLCVKSIGMGRRRAGSPLHAWRRTARGDRGLQTASFSSSSSSSIDKARVKPRGKAYFHISTMGPEGRLPCQPCSKRVAGASHASTGVQRKTRQPWGGSFVTATVSRPESCSSPVKQSTRRRRSPDS